MNLASIKHLSLPRHLPLIDSSCNITHYSKLNLIMIYGHSDIYGWVCLNMLYNLKTNHYVKEKYFWKMMKKNFLQNFLQKPQLSLISE